MPVTRMARIRGQTVESKKTAIGARIDHFSRNRTDSYTV